MVYFCAVWRQTSFWTHKLCYLTALFTAQVIMFFLWASICLHTLVVLMYNGVQCRVFTEWLNKYFPQWFYTPGLCLLYFIQRIHFFQNVLPPLLLYLILTPLHGVVKGLIFRFLLLIIFSNQIYFQVNITKSKTICFVLHPIYSQCRLLIKNHTSEWHQTPLTINKL